MGPQVLDTAFWNNAWALITVSGGWGLMCAHDDAVPAASEPPLGYSVAAAPRRVQRRAQLTRSCPAAVQWEGTGWLRARSARPAPPVRPPTLLPASPLPARLPLADHHRQQLPDHRQFGGLPVQRLYQQLW